MDIVFEYLKEINIAQLISIALMGWFFYCRLNNKIEKLDVDLSNKIEKLNVDLSKKIEKVDGELSNKIEKSDEKLIGKIDKLNEKVEDIDRRLCRIEGSLSTHGHCLFNQGTSDKKAV